MVSLNFGEQRGEVNNNLHVEKESLVIPHGELGIRVFTVLQKIKEGDESL
jgi:hypothetical protein